MTITLFCCYHCASFTQSGSKSCNQGKVLCYNALMSIKDESFRKDCRRNNGECAERFEAGEARVAHKCFSRKGGG